MASTVIPLMEWHLETIGLVEVVPGPVGPVEFGLGPIGLVVVGPVEVETAEVGLGQVGLVVVVLAEMMLLLVEGHSEASTQIILLYGNIV